MSDYLCGKNTVLSLLKTEPSRIFKIFVIEGHKPDRRLHEITELAQTAKIPVQYVPRAKLEGLLRQDKNQPGQDAQHRQNQHAQYYQDQHAQHQGIVASVAPKKLLTLPELIAQVEPEIQTGQFPLLLMLDGVTDPRNFGAILRVSDAAGVAGIIIPKHNSAGFGPAVSKTASGAEASVPVAVVSNLAQAVDKLKKAGFWTFAALQNPESPLYDRQDYRMPVLLILGSEGEGISPILTKACDFSVRIPMRGIVDSLNVATAAAILVFHIQSQHGHD